jgi:hypothetical protein
VIESEDRMSEDGCGRLFKPKEKERRGEVL